MPLEVTNIDKFEDALDEAKVLHGAQSIRRRGSLVWHAGGVILCRMTVLDRSITYEADFESLEKISP